MVFISKHANALGEAAHSIINQTMKKNIIIFVTVYW